VVTLVNSTLRTMLGRKMGKSVTGWRKLHKDDLHSFYFSPVIIAALIRENTTDRACSILGRRTL